MPVQHHFGDGAEIPCGHCGEAIWLSMAQVLPVLGVQCASCGHPIRLYVEGLLDDMIAASDILAERRRRRLDR